MSWGRSAAKRALDLAAGGALLVVTAPLAALVAVVVALTLGRPILFRQRRSGLDGRPFTLVKFRSMRDARDAAGKLLPDEERLTAIGRLLRRSSLDELPELVHVVRGEMSLVGPRPLLPRYLERYSARQARRHEVRPGLTGWAVVKGRNAVDWPARLELDVWYVEHASFRLDAKILAMTLALVVTGRGVSAAGEATMREFEGTAELDADSTVASDEERR